MEKEFFPMSNSSSREEETHESVECDRGKNKTHSRVQENHFMFNIGKERSDYSFSRGEFVTVDIFFLFFSSQAGDFINGEIAVKF